MWLFADGRQAWKHAVFPNTILLICGLWCQKQFSQARISNCIPQYTVGCNYLSLPEIPASGTSKFSIVGEQGPESKSSMMTSSNENIFRVTGHLCVESPVTDEFPTQRPVTRSFDVFFDLRLNKRLSKQSQGWWFETPSCLSWRHCNVLGLYRLEIDPTYCHDLSAAVHFDLFHDINPVLLCFVLLWLYHVSIVNSCHLFTHILQGWLTSTGAIKWHQYQGRYAE